MELTVLIFFSIPFAAIVFFVISLCGYLGANKRYKAAQDEVAMQEKKKYKTLLIVSSVIMGVLLAIVISFMALMFMAVAYM